MQAYLQQEGNPVWQFGDHLTQLILKLLTVPYDQLVMSIINMLKVEGVAFHHC